MVIGILSIFAFNLADTYFVAKLGSKELAAITFTFPVVSFLAALSLGLGMGVTSVIGRAYGEGDFSKVRCLATDSLSLAFIFVSILSLMGLLTIKPLFELLGAKGEVLQDVIVYMRVWYFGMPFVVIPMVGNGVIRGSGNFSFPMWVMLIAGLTNIIFDYILIFGKFGFPEMGLEGAAIATVISRALTLVASLFFLFLKQKVVVNPFKRVGILKSWKYIIEMALPSGLMNIINPSALGIITALVAPFGEHVIAGFGVGMRIESFAMIPLFALSSALNPVLAQNWGNESFIRVDEAMRKSFFFSLGWGFLMIIFFQFFSLEIVREFSVDPLVQKAGVDFLHISPWVYGVEGVIMYIAVFFVAIGFPNRSMLISFFRFGVFYLPLAWLGAKSFEYKGVFLSKVISGYMSVVMSYIWWKREKIKEISK